MLDSVTKRRIDTARDILVGKVPDPKSQVEQITIALIYKFMDDMDAQAEEVGGKRKFFVGEFAEYRWAKIMRGGLSGAAMVKCYEDGARRMPNNPGAPMLFRKIFDGYRLPFGDPETLRLFLKEIDGFEYDHSERLGDAFEYLLSVLGSQGDAGQFRTPRHIIDFIVKVVDPKKTDTILDPACGTAGFLISAYKHILSQNRSTGVPPVAAEHGRDARATPIPPTPLTPDEKKKLAANLKGYDISPDMVRLSLVNLYLHGFTSPQIEEYDTLTSQDKWNEVADCILANPPFMSPKGGIKPHDRFGVKSKRSEVLFVDYMAEHLTPTGRAGIIVPEGIIFQSQTAYVSLRKMLVEQYLVAVVSLPAGIFQPYSGVKTSILVFDKSIAKHADTVGFFKVESDGFGLGAQRRAVEKNDLPQVAAEIAEYLKRLRNRESLEGLTPVFGLIVPKEKIAANGDYNLSGERYREGGVQHQAFPWVTIESVVRTVTPPTKIQKTAFGSSGRFPIIDQSQDAIAGWTDDETALVRPTKPLVIFGDHTCAVKIMGSAFAQGADGIKILEASDSLEPRYLYQVLRARPLPSNGYQRHFSLLKEYEIPLPPLSVQKEIVAEIEAYQKVIDGARAVLDHYRPHIPIQPDWPMVLIGDIVDFVSGLTVSIPEVESEGGIPIIAINNVTEEGELTLEGLRFITPPTKTLNFCRKGDLLFNWRNGSKHLVGKTALFNLDGEYLFASFLIGIRVHADRVDHRYMWHTLNIYRKTGMYVQFMRENVNGLFNREELKITKIPLPPLSEQERIVSEIEAEQRLVAGNRELIERFEKKIQQTLARVWGEAPEAVQDKQLKPNVEAVTA